MKKYLIHCFLPLLCFSLSILCFQGIAWALSIPDILNMASHGFDEVSIIKMIETSEDLPVPSKDEEKLILESGLSEAVINAIYKKTGKENLISKPEEVNVGSSVREELQEKEEESVQSFVEAQVFSDSPLALPVQNSNLPTLLQKFYETARQSFLIHAEVQRKYDSLQKDHEKVLSGTDFLPELQQLLAQVELNPSKSFQRALEIRGEKTFEESSLAAALLHQILGLSALRLGLNAVAAKNLDRALQYSPATKNYREVFDAYISSSRKARFILSRPESVLNNVSALTKEQTSELLYAAAYAYIYSENKDEEKAVALLEKIQSQDFIHAKALLLLATVQIGPERNQFRTAAQNLQKAAEIIKKYENDEAFQVKNSLQLALARIAFENGLFEAAAEFYLTIPVESHQFLTAGIENAWASYFGQRYSEALAYTMAFYAPQWKERYFPELHIIEAASLLKLCRHKEASAAIERFNRNYLPIVQDLQRFSANYKVGAYFAELLNFSKKRSETSLAPRVFDAILSNPNFRAAYLDLRQSADEEKHCKSLARSEVFLKPLCEELTQLRLAGEVKVNERMAEAIESIKAQIHGLDINASEIAIEIKLAEKAKEEHCLRIAARGGKCINEEQVQIAPYFILENIQFWKFSGEFWRDELVSFKSRIASACPKE